MPNHRTADLFDLIPNDSSYGRGSRRDASTDAEIDAFAQANNDPALRAKFVDAFVEVRQPLPACIHDSELLRTYAHRRFGAPDADVEAAFAIEHDSNKINRTRLRCMLLRREYTYADIGKRLGFSENTVRIYQALFWPVRDRDGFFVSSLVYPRSRQCEFEPGYGQNETQENLAYRAALRSGMEAVERWLGMNNTIMKKTVNEMADNLARRFLENAEFLADMGFLNQDLPGLKNGLAVLRMLNSGRRRHQKPAAMGLINGVSAAVAVSESLERPGGIPDRLCWSGGATVTDASKKGSAGRKAEMPAVSGEQTSPPMRAKSKKTASPFSTERAVQVDSLDVAA